MKRFDRCFIFCLTEKAYFSNSRFGISTAFWGLVVGILSLVLLNAYKNSDVNSLKNLFFVKKEVSF
jgi:hypothetical protein